MLKLFSTITLCFTIETIMATPTTYTNTKKYDDFAFNAPYVTEPILVCGSEPTAYELENTIRKGMEEAGPSLAKELTHSTYSLNLAEEILTVSKCFQIDPIFLSGLIASESLFISELTNSIGAIGLGQLLPNALEEVGLQLGAPGAPPSHYATKGQKAYFETAINCALALDYQKKFPELAHFQEDINFDLSYSTHAMTHWWNLQGLKDLRKSRKMSTSVVNLLKTNRLTNLIYSAMIFKIFYSRARMKWKNLKIEELSQSKKIQLMEETIAKYKGAPSTKSCKPMYRRVRLWSNRLLEEIQQTDSGCYRPQFGK